MDTTSTGFKQNVASTEDNSIDDVCGGIVEATLGEVGGQRGEAANIGPPVH